MPRWELAEERKERRIPVASTLPLSLVSVIDSIADSERIAVAEVLRRVIRKGLEVERAEREAKHQARLVHEQRVGHETL